MSAGTYCCFGKDGRLIVNEHVPKRHETVFLLGALVAAVVGAAILWAF